MIIMNELKELEIEIEKLLLNNDQKIIDDQIMKMEMIVNKRPQLHILTSVKSLQKYIEQQKRKDLFEGDEITLLKHVTRKLCQKSINYIRNKRDLYWSNISKELNKRVENLIFEKFNFLEQLFEQQKIIVDDIHTLDKIAEAKPIFTQLKNVEDFCSDFTEESLDQNQIKSITSKIAALHMTGVLKKLYENKQFKDSNNSLAGFLSIFLGEKKTSIQPILSAINSYCNNTDYRPKNNPFNNQEAIKKLQSILISYGINQDIIEENSPLKS